MRVSGATFVRNALKFDYPVVESIRSILPVCDEFIVNVGESEDETLGLIESIGDPRVRIVRSAWDETSRRTSPSPNAAETGSSIFRPTRSCTRSTSTP